MLTPAGECLGRTGNLGPGASPESTRKRRADGEAFLGHGRSGDGQGVQLSNDTGYFWFFADTNVELMVKVLERNATWPAGLSGSTG